MASDATNKQILMAAFSNTDALLKDINISLNKLIEISSGASAKKDDSSDEKKREERNRFSLFSGFGKLGRMKETFSGDGMKTAASTVKDLVTGLVELQKVKVDRVEKVLNPVEKFFVGISKAVNDSKDMKETISSFDSVLKTIVSVVQQVKVKDLFGLIVLNKLLSPKMVKKLDDFFSMLAGVSKKVTKANVENLVNLMKGVSKMMTSFLLVASGVALITLILGPLGAVGAFAVVAFMMTFSIKVIDRLSKIKKADLKNAIDAAKIMSYLMLGMATIALGIVLIGRSASLEEIGMGILVIAASVGIPLAIMKILSKLDSNFRKNAKAGLKDLMAVTLGIAGIALSIVLIGKIATWQDVLAGTAIMAVSVLSMWVISKMLKGMKKTSKDAAKALLMMVGVIALFSIVALLLFPAIVKKAPEVILGGIIIIGMTFLLGLALKSIIKVGKVVGKNLMGIALFYAGTIVIAGIAMLMSSVVARLGKLKAADFWQGMLGVALIIVMIGAVIILVLDMVNQGDSWVKFLPGFNKETMPKNRKYAYFTETNMKNGAKMLGLMLGFGIGLMAVAHLFAGFLERMANIDGATIGKGSAVLLGLIAVMGGAVIGVIALQKTKFFNAASLSTAAATLAVMIGFGATLAIVSHMFAGLFERLSKLSWEDIGKGGAVVGGILLALVGVVAGIGAIATTGIGLVVIGLGVALVSAIAVSMGLIGIVITQYINLIERASGISEETLESGSSVISGVLGKMSGLIFKVGGIAMTGIGAAVIIAGAGLLTVMGTVMGLLGFVIGQYIGLVEKYAKASSKYGDLSAYGKEISSVFFNFVKELGDSVDLTTMMKISILGWLTDDIGEIIENVSDYMDVIVKVASAQIVVGYDEKGKPKFKKLSTKDLNDAGSVVAGQFNHFLTTLMDGLQEGWEDKEEVLEMLSENIGGIMIGVSKYVDAIMKAASGTYLYGYDKDGHGLYKKITSDDVEKAADAINRTFSSFISSLYAASVNMRPYVLEAMEGLGESLLPALNGISSYVDGIIMVATARRVVGYDEHGNPNKWEEITATFDGKTYAGVEAIAQAGTSVGDMFSKFIKNVYGALTTADTRSTMKKIGDWLTGGGPKDTAETAGKVLQNLIKFMDSLVKISSGNIITGYDENGNPKYKQIELYTSKGRFTGLGAIIKGGELIGNVFLGFISKTFDTITASKKYGQERRAFVKAVMETMEPVLEVLDTFVDIITKFASKGVIYPIIGYDKNGKPKYDTKNPVSVTEAANNLVDSFHIFYVAVYQRFKNFDREVGDKILDNIGFIGDNMKPITEAMSTFADLLGKINKIDDIEAVREKTKSALGLLAYVTGYGTYDGKENGEKAPIPWEKKDSFISNGSYKNVETYLNKGIEFTSYMLTAANNMLSIGELNNLDKAKANSQAILDILDLICDSGVSGYDKMISSSGSDKDASNVKSSSSFFKRIFSGSSNDGVSKYFDAASGWTSNLVSIASDIVDLARSMNETKGGPKGVVDTYLSAISSIANSGLSRSGMIMTSYSWSFKAAIDTIEKSLFENRKERKEALDELSMSLNEIAIDFNNIANGLDNLANLKQMNLASMITLRAQQNPGMTRVMIPNRMTTSADNVSFLNPQQQRGTYQEQNQRPQVALAVNPNEDGAPKTIIVEFANTKLEGRLINLDS